MNHDVKHIVSVQELLTSLIEESRKRPGHMTRDDLKVRIATGPGKHQAYLISSIYYSPETQSIWIDAEN